MIRTAAYVPQEIVAGLHELHRRCGRDTSQRQSIRGGTQITLSGQSHPIALRTSAVVSAALAGALKEPFRLAGLWSIRMQKGGSHVEHNHPEGWLSGVWYVDVPDRGSAHLRLAGGAEIEPRAGLIVLFPSWLVHATTAYAGEEPRLTVGFDLVKA